jgi:anti-anti-sigma factor
LSDHEDARIVAPAGRLDALSAPAFLLAVNTALQAGDADLLIDLAAVSYISSAGLRVILIAAKSLAGRGRRLALCSLGPRVAQVIELGEFDSLANLSIYPDRAAALVGRWCS